MPRVTRPAAYLAVVVALACACSAQPPSPATFDLPGPTSQPTACGGVGAGLVILRGGPNDERLTWETALDGSGRQEVVWPPGYRARFAPTLEVFDATGGLLARDGDRVPGGGCAVGPAEDPTGLVLVQPADWARR